LAKPARTKNPEGARRRLMRGLSIPNSSELSRLKLRPVNAACGPAWIPDIFGKRNFLYPARNLPQSDHLPQIGNEFAE
jgi:hypothetical protein